MLADRLSKAWGARRGSTPIEPVMRFSDEGLVLGAGTVLARSNGSGRAIAVDPSGPRLHALLTAAHLRRPTAGALAHLRKAAERWSQGHDGLATMHLALSQVGRLERPEADAQRLFLAGELLDAGFEADTIVDAIEAGGPALERLQKYNPIQPRVPAGSGRPSGQWTSGGDGSAASAVPEAGVIPGVIGATAREIAEADACYQAKKDCYIEALKDHDPDQHANDNWKQTDIANCEFAEWGCIVLGVAIHHVPLLDRGGVIFPHGGVVILEKGKQDLYIRPPARGKIPPFRRSL